MLTPSVWALACGLASRATRTPLRSAREHTRSTTNVSGRRDPWPVQTSSISTARPSRKLPQNLADHPITLTCYIANKGNCVPWHSVERLDRRLCSRLISIDDDASTFSSEHGGNCHVRSLQQTPQEFEPVPVTIVTFPLIRSMASAPRSSVSTPISVPYATCMPSSFVDRWTRTLTPHASLGRSQHTGKISGSWKDRERRPS